MTDDIQLTRRRILAGLGAVGAAGTGVGYGTSALLADEETFEGNTIAAGTLDLVVDWEERYSAPQAIEDDVGDPTEDLAVTRTDPGDDAYVGVPDPGEPMVWIHEDDLETYLDRTAIDAYPDPDDDGRREVAGGLDAGGFVYDACSDGATRAEHLDPAGLRTANADTASADAPGAPLVDLAGVAPGDFGELTFSFTLCESPGHVWLQADDVEILENDVAGTGTGADDPREPGALAEQIRTAWWYDLDEDGVPGDVGPVDVVLAVDASGSLSDREVASLQADATSLATALWETGDARVGGLSFGDGSISNFTGLDEGPASFTGLSPGGNRPLPAALEIAAAELEEHGRPDASTHVVLVTAGGPNYENDTYRAGGHRVGDDYTGGIAADAVTDAELCETASVAADVRADHSILTVGIDDGRLPTSNESPVDCEGAAIASLSQYLRDYVAGGRAHYVRAADPRSLGSLESELVSAIARSESVFHRGTLAADLDRLSRDSGIRLDGDRTNDVDEFEDESADRECFQPGVPVSIGFAWWLPLEADNEVQGDAVRFDLGFYAEQCRNNAAPESTR